MRNILCIVLTILNIEASITQDFNSVDVIVNRKFLPITLPYLNFITFDEISQNIFVAGVDFVYQLDGTTLETITQSANLSNIENYSTNYFNSVTACKAIYQDSEACRNHVRVVQRMKNGNLYICSTGAYNPQEYYLDGATLSTITVGDRGLSKCPNDPFSKNLFYSTGDYLYTALQVSPQLGFQIVRVQINSSSLANLKNDVVLKDVAYISAIEIDNYIYFFFRESSGKDSALGGFQQSKVARICKNDNGGKMFGDQFMTYTKARIVCLINKTGKNPVVFNHLVDMQFDSVRRVFIGLFQMNDNLNFGSALCVYSYTSVDKVFRESTYMAFKISNWVNIQSQTVTIPNPRLSSCEYDTKTLNLTVELFAVDWFVMADVVEQSSQVPPFYTNEFAFHHFTHFTINNTHSVFYFVSVNDRLTVKRYLVNLFSNSLQTLQDVTLITSVQPSKIMDICIYKYNDTSYVYVLYSNVLLQFPVEICSSYYHCTSCVADIMCSWQKNICISNADHQINDSIDPIKACASSCYVSKANITAIPGMSATLPLISKCRVPGAVQWFVNNSKVVVGDDRFVLSANSSLIILSYGAADTGDYKCVGEGVTLIEYSVQSSVCEFKEDLRSVMISEFKNWCSAMDHYARR